MPDHVDDVLAAWRRELPGALTGTSELSKRVLDLARTLSAAMADAVSPFDLSVAEYDILAALRRTPAPRRLTPSQLAAELILSSGGVTKALHALAGRGLIERQLHPADRRRSFILLTPAGESLSEKAVTASASAQHATFTGVASRDTAATTRVLRALMQCLDNGPNLRR